MSSLIAETPCSPNSLSPVGADCELLTFPSQSTLQLLHHPFNSTLTKNFFHPTGISSPEQNKPSDAVSGQPKETKISQEVLASGRLLRCLVEGWAHAAAFFSAGAVSPLYPPSAILLMRIEIAF